MATSVPPTDTGASAPEPAGESNKPADWRQLISPEVKADIAARRARNEVIAQIAQTNWGKALDIHTARAVADWAYRYGIDAAQEIDVLGGRVYLNARFYLNRMAKLIKAGVVAYAFADHVGVDARLDALVEASNTPEDVKEKCRREIMRRAMERIQNGAPENAKAVVVFRIKLANVPVEFTGCKWTGTGRRNPKDASKFADPVGEEYPTETAETRAARRACRLLVSHIPDVAEWIDAATDDAAATVDVALDKAIGKSKQAAIAEAGALHPQLLQLPEGDAYVDITAGKQPEPVRVEVKTVAERGAEMVDPLGGELPAGENATTSSLEPEDFQDDRKLAED